MIVKILDSVETYEEAIKYTCDKLEEAGAITPSYYQAILGKIEEFGAYFCLEKDMAMPHARPEDGALQTDLCILKLNQPVDFLGKSVSVLFTISAKDNDSHLGLLQKIAGVCMNRAKLDSIIDAKTEKEIMEVM